MEEQRPRTSVARSGGKSSAFDIRYSSFSFLFVNPCPLPPAPCSLLPAFIINTGLLIKSIIKAGMERFIVVN